MARGVKGYKETGGQPGRRLRIPLSFKFAAVTVALVGLLLLLSAGVSLWQAHDAAERSALAAQRQKADALAARVEGFVANLESQLAWTAQPDWRTAGIDQQRTDFARILRQFPAVTELFYIDSRGFEQLKVSRLAPDSVGSQTGRAGEPRFVETVKTRTWFGPVYVRNGAELAGTVGVAHTDGGVTVAELDLAFLADFVRTTAGEGTETFIVDGDGRLVGHPTRNPVAEGSDLSALPQMATALAVGGAGTFTDALMEADSEPAFAAYSQVSRLGWTVFAQTPKAEALSSFYFLLWLTIAILASGLIVAALAGAWLARRVSLPIGQLRAGAQRLGEGDLSQRVSIRNRDEIGALAEKFNTMASRLQQSQRGLEAKADERAHGLDVAMQQQTLTAGVLRAIGRSDQSLETVLETLVVSAVEICEASRGSVWLMRDKELRLAAQAGHGDDWKEAAKDVALEVAGDAETPLGLAAYLGQPVSVEDLPGDQRFALGVAPGYAGDRAGLAVPLQRDGKVEGVIWLSHEEAAPFSERQSGLVQGFADQALIAIENARLADNVDARDRGLAAMRAEQAAIAEAVRVVSQSPADADPALDAIVDTAFRILGGNCAYLSLFDGAVLNVQVQRGMPPEALEAVGAVAPTADTLATRAFVAAEAVELASLADPSPELCVLPDTRNALAVSLVRGGLPVGVIAVERNEAGALPERHVELLKVLADQAVIALGSARLSADLATREDELSKSLAVREQERSTTLAHRNFVEELVRAMTAPALDLAVVARQLGRHIAEECGADAVQIFRRDGETYRPVGEDGPEYSPGRGSLVGRVAETGRPAQILDCWDDPEIEHKDAWVRSMLGLPLRSGGMTVGVLSLARANVAPFSDADVALTAAFADLAAIAIEKSDLLDDAGRRSAEIADLLGQKAASAQTLSLIGRTPFDLQRALQRMAAYAADICGAAKVLVLRRVDGAYSPIAANGVSDRDWDEIRNDIDGLAGGVLGRVEATATPAQVEDLAAGMTEAGTPQNSGAALAVPMLWDGTVSSVFLLLRNQPGRFGDREIEFVESLADQATIAVGRTDLEDRLVTTTHELEQMLAHKQAASRIVAMSNGAAADPQPVLDAIVEEAATLCGADAASLLLMREDGMRRVSGQGEDDPALASWIWPYLDAAPTIHVPDLSAEVGLTNLAGQTNSGSLVAISLARQGHVSGMLLVRRHAPVPFGARQVELAETLAGQACLAMENATLFADLSTRNGELSDALDQQRAVATVARAIGETGGRRGFDFDRLLRGMTATARRLAGADVAAVYLYGEDGYHLATSDGMAPERHAFEQAHAYPAGRDTLVGRTAFDKAMIHVPDMSAEEDLAQQSEDMAALGVPLMRDGEAIGVFVATRATRGPFDEGEIGLVRTFADQAAAAIDKLGLGEEVKVLTADLESARQEQNAVATAARTIGGAAYDLGSLLQALVVSASRLCGASTARIYLREQDAYPLAAALGMTAEQRAFENANPLTPERESWAGGAVFDRTVVHLPDSATHDEHEFRRFGPVASMLCVPLVHRDVTIGLLVLARAQAGPFDAHQIELAKTFADQATIAIENVRLFDEVQRRSDETAILTDELGAARERLSETERLAALGQFTSGIMHEIRTPLDFVREFSARSKVVIDAIRDVLEHAVLDVDTRGEVEELADSLSDGIKSVAEYGRRADFIIGNMLAHARDAGEHRMVDINTMVDESLGLAYHGARAERRDFHIRLQKALDPKAGSVDLYPQEITRVLLNVISNGFDATQQRGVAANGSGYEPVLSASTRNLGDAVEISIRDNGTGVEADVREKMFEPFFTTKPAGQGTGLGLSQSHDIIVKQHAGTIEVVTEPGSFTEFRIVLPRGAASLASRTNGEGSCTPPS